MKVYRNDVLIKEAELKDANAIARVLVDSFPDKFVAIFGKKRRKDEKH